MVPYNSGMSRVLSGRGSVRPCFVFFFLGGEHSRILRTMSKAPKEKVAQTDAELEELKRRQARAKVRDPQRGSCPKTRPDA
jgi:hypothetical protein